MIHELALKIDAYISSSKNRSLLELSKDASTPYITLRRIMQKEVKAIGIEAAVSILRVIEPKAKDVLDFVQKHYPKNGKLLKDVLSQEGCTAFINSDLSRFFDDYKMWYAVCLAESERGTSQEELTYLFGEKSAQEIVDALELSGLTEIKNGCIHLKDKNFVTSFSLDTQLKEVTHFCSAFDKSRISDPGFLLASGTSPRLLSEEALEQIKELMREVTNRAIAIMSDEKSKGDNLYYFGIVSGVLARKDVSYAKV